MMFSNSGQASKAKQGSIKKHNSELFGVLLQVIAMIFVFFVFFNMIFMLVVYVCFL